jgi:hypothetical protein
LRLNLRPERPWRMMVLLSVQASHTGLAAVSVR